jgi:hypothetical protein
VLDGDELHLLVGQQFQLVVDCVLLFHLGGGLALLERVSRLDERVVE